MDNDLRQPVTQVLEAEMEDTPYEATVVSRPPSCIAICPSDYSIIVLGTYSLHDEPVQDDTPQSRSGGIEIYKIRREVSGSGFGLSRCLASYDLPDCAVLDLHFLPDRPAHFAVCTSTSELFFFHLEGVGPEGGGSLTDMNICEVSRLALGEEPGVIATAFTLMPQLNDPSGSSKLAVSYSTGDVEVVEVNCPTSSATYTPSIGSKRSIKPAHSLEAWTATFITSPVDKQEETWLLTGGDDSVLALHSIGQKVIIEEEQKTEICRDRKSHSAGVTAILPIFQHLDTVEPVFLTGSYDEHIRLFTIQQSRTTLVIDLILGGGVWRLSQISESIEQTVEDDLVLSTTILASCMHAGVRIVRISRRRPANSQRGEQLNRWEMGVVGEFTAGHESMCYGSAAVDVGAIMGSGDSKLVPRHKISSDNDFVVASTSFYDRKLCVWEWKDPVERP